MKMSNERLVEFEEKVKRLNLNNPNKPVSKEPVKHVSTKPGHIQARDCSTEYWFK